MTTTVKVHVNGRYRANVKVSHASGDQEELVVEGAYDGSPNPTGYGYVYMRHPADAVIRVSEEPVPAEENKQPEPSDGQDA